MNVHRSNRLEALADALARAIEAPLSSVFATETILVPSRALAAWLTEELAKRHGVCANAEFLTPRAWLDALASPGEGGDPFAPEALTWSVAAVLPGRLAEPAFAEVRRYLADDAGGEKRLALSTRVAGLFDRYVLHRPELVDAWERGEDAGWQAELFRAVVATHGRAHLAARVRRLTGELEAGRKGGLPERLTLFHVGPLAPVVRRAVEAVAAAVPVHAFELAEGAAIAPEPSLLGALQRGAPGAAPAQRDPADRTVSVHVCHGPTRECEVLRDQLLAAFEADPSLEPRDVRVLVSDVDAYAGAIDAVFGGDPRDTQHLPHRLADRPRGAALPAIEAFFALLDVAGSRMGAPAVVDLLHREPIRTRFGLGEADVETVRGWIADAGVRWAADEAHREEVGQPALRQNTWGFGIDRLLLGYVMGADGDATFSGALPFGELDGSDGLALGGLSAFVEALSALRRELLGRAPLEAWRARLTGALGRFVVAGRDTERQHQLLRGALGAICARAERAGFHEEIPLTVVRDALVAEVGDAGAGGGHGAGAITFAKLGPGRAAPARIIALLGMSDGAFPRAPRALGFDLMASDPQPGDPSARDDDRRVFREAVLAARERLVVTFVGRSIENDAPLPPSVLVSELLDAIDAAFAPEGEGKRPASDGVLVAHALHAFSPRYFRADEDERLFSHSATACDTARAMLAPRASEPAFVGAEVPPPPGEAEGRPVTVDELCQFFMHPVEAFVKRRVGVHLAEEEAALADREPLELGTLERWALLTSLVARARAGDSVREAPAEIAASGALPPGTVGSVLYDELHPGAAEMGALVRAQLGPTAPEPLEIDLTLDGGARVLGWLRSVGPNGQVLHRCSQARAKFELDAWIRHLAMLAAGVHRPTFLILRAKSGEPVVRELAPVARARDHLKELVALYRLGQRLPLPLFPDPASAYGKALAKGVDAALSAAKRAYDGGFDGKGNAYVEKVFGAADPIDPSHCLFERDDPDEPWPSFAELAERVFLPLHAHMEELS